MIAIATTRPGAARAGRCEEARALVEQRWIVCIGTLSPKRGEVEVARIGATVSTSKPAAAGSLAPRAAPVDVERGHLVAPARRRGAARPCRRQHRAAGLRPSGSARAEVGGRSLPARRRMPRERSSPYALPARRAEQVAQVEQRGVGQVRTGGLCPRPAPHRAPASSPSTTCSRPGSAPASFSRSASSAARVPEPGHPPDEGASGSQSASQTHETSRPSPVPSLSTRTPARPPRASACAGPRWRPPGLRAGSTAGSRRGRSVSAPPNAGAAAPRPGHAGEHGADVRPSAARRARCRRCRGRAAAAPRYASRRRKRERSRADTAQLGAESTTAGSGRRGHGAGTSSGRSAK